MKKKEFHNIEAERCILTGMLADSQRLCYGCENLKEQDFFFPENKIIFASLIGIYKDNSVPSLEKLIIMMKNSGTLDGIGGIDVLTKAILTIVVTLGDMEDYVKVIRSHSVMRQITASLKSLSSDIESGKVSSGADMLDVCRETFYCIDDVQDGELGIDFREYYDSIGEKALIDQKALYLTSGESSCMGCPSGLPGLDSLTGGLKKGQLVTIAARTGMGKTQLGLNFFTSLAKSGHPSFMFSLEMSVDDLLRRMYSILSGISLETVQRSTYSADELLYISSAVRSITKGNCLINDKSKLTLEDIISKIRRSKEKYNIQCVFIDYLQLISTRSKFESRHLEVAEITRNLKIVAKDLELPIVCLAQLSRKTEERVAHRPMLSDLRESGSIEHDSDVVIALHRRDYYDKFDRPGEAELLVLKNRNGAVGDVRLSFDATTGKFSCI